MNLKFTAMPTQIARAYQNGGLDAYGQRPERSISGGPGHPCRHCLRDTPKGAPMLILAHRPFADLQPYAETGPIFLCADECTRGGGTDKLPQNLTSDSYIVRGYGADDRIVYGSGGVTATPDILVRAAELMAGDRVAYVHVRSASNNCFAVRIDPQ